MSSDEVIQVKKLLAKESPQENADVSLVEVKAFIESIQRLEKQLDPDKLNQPVDWYTLNPHYINRVTVEDWGIFGGISVVDWQTLHNHKADIERMLNV